MVSVDLFCRDNGLRVLYLFARVIRVEGYIDLQDTYQIQFIDILEVFILAKHGFQF